MSGTSTGRGPYRTSAEIEKEVKPTRFRKFIYWWNNNCFIVVVLTVIIGLLGLSIFGIVEMWQERSANINHGKFVCQQNYYVITEYPAVGLKKIVCLSANGEEKNVFEETNK